MLDTEKVPITATVEERYEEWLKRAAEIAKELKIQIEFTTESARYAYSEYRVACADVSGTDPDYGFYSYEGCTYINY
jgi:hypothetical protein